MKFIEWNSLDAVMKWYICMQFLKKYKKSREWICLDMKICILVKISSGKTFLLYDFKAKDQSRVNPNADYCLSLTACSLQEILNKKLKRKYYTYSSTAKNNDHLPTQLGVYMRFPTPSPESPLMAKFTENSKISHIMIQKINIVTVQPSDKKNNRDSACTNYRKCICWQQQWDFGYLRIVGSFSFCRTHVWLPMVMRYELTCSFMYVV